MMIIIRSGAAPQKTPPAYSLGASLVEKGAEMPLSGAFKKITVMVKRPDGGRCVTYHQQKRKGKETTLEDLHRRVPML